MKYLIPRSILWLCAFSGAAALSACASGEGTLPGGGDDILTGAAGILGSNEPVAGMSAPTGGAGVGAPVAGFSGQPTAGTGDEAGSGGEAGSGDVGTGGAGSGGFAGSGSAGSGSAGSGSAGIGGGTAGIFGGFAGTGGTGGSAGTGSAGTGAAGMCENLACWDVFDCALFHPNEYGPCGFTKCEGFVCKK